LIRTSPGVVTAPAVDGAVSSRNEGHLSFSATGGANGLVQDAASATPLIGHSCSSGYSAAVLLLAAARWASGRIVLKSLLLIEGLLSGGEDEGGSAVAADDCAIIKGHGSNLASTPRIQGMIRVIWEPKA
jgi:hypothetical protein